MFCKSFNDKNALEIPNARISLLYLLEREIMIKNMCID